jgi:hypothetical protein
MSITKATSRTSIGTTWGVVAEHVAAQYLLSKTRASQQADVAGVVDAEIWR